MTEEIKKRICEKAGVVYIEEEWIGWAETKLKGILVSAMWAVNREFKEKEKGFFISDFTHFLQDPSYLCSDVDRHLGKEFILQNHNNSEQEALTAALTYVMEKSK